MYPPLPPAFQALLARARARLGPLGASRAPALALMVLGIAALALPLAAGTALAVLLTWLLLLAGVVHIAHSITARRIGTFAWHAAIGLAYVFSWAFLIPRPSLGLNMITLVAAFLFIAEGAMRAAVYARVRRAHPSPVRASPWPLLDGLLTLALGIGIFWTWPQSSAWAVGMLLGLNLLLSGMSRLLEPTISTAQRAAVLRAIWPRQRPVHRR